MLQINGYHQNQGIAQHFDEVVWFPAPVHSCRLGGFAQLHFGMQGRGAAPYQNLKELFIQINDCEFFQMTGIFQILYRHGIPRGEKYLSDNTVTVLLRKANEHACGKSLRQSQV